MRWLQQLGSMLLGSPGGAALWTPSWTASRLGSGGARNSTSGEIVDVVTAGALPALYRACSFIADSLASVDLRIVEVQPDGGKKVVGDSDVARALSEWSYADREMFLFQAALGGNGLAVLRKNSRGGIQALESVAARRVMAAQDEAGSIFFAIAPFMGPGTGEPEILAAQDVALLRYRNIGDHLGRTVFGVPPIVTCAEQLGLVLAARKFQSIIWKKGAVPAGVLTTPKTLKQPVIDRLRAQWDEYYKGDVLGRTAILEDGLTYAPVKPGMTPADSSLVEYNRFGVEEVSRLYGVPPSVLGQTGNASYSTATEEFRAAVLHCLRPWAARFTDCLDRALLTREQRLKGMRIEAPLDHLLVAPGKETSEYLKELVNAGILNTNECRNVLGYPDIAGGELHRVPVNMTALDNLPKIGLNSKPTPQETP